jgi:hypothetical protein
MANIETGKTWVGLEIICKLAEVGDRAGGNATSAAAPDAAKVNVS